MEEKFEQSSLSAESLAKKLNSCSPLQASKVLIDTELFEKKSSLKVLDEIYDHFDSKDSIIDELVTPIGLNVLDGIISHEKLNLSRTGLTASRVWNEIKGFDYSVADVNQSSLSNKQNLNGIGNDIRLPTDFDRGALVDQSAMKAYHEKYFNGKDTALSEIESEGGKAKIIYRNEATAGAENKGQAANVDHTISAKSINDKYSSNTLLKQGDLKAAANSEANFTMISASTNKSKSEFTYKERQEQKARGENPDAVFAKTSDETYQKGIKAEKAAAEAVQDDLMDSALENLKSLDKDVADKVGKVAYDQTSYQVLGTAIIEMIKPLFYEISDSIKHGLEMGIGESDFAKALKKRFARVLDYISKVILPTLKGAIKDFFQNVSNVIVASLLDLAKGMFKSILTIISEGFSAIISAVKILCTDPKDMSSAEKGDAIVKLLATTASTFVTFYFSETIVRFIPSPFNDIMTALVSGVASTIVVYFIDKLDLFSVKSEKRSKMVANIFQERIATIKKNTDAFDATSIKALAEQKLAFKQLYSNLENGIESDMDVTANVNSVADFFKIELDIRDTDSFLSVLEREKVLVI